MSTISHFRDCIDRFHEALRAAIDQHGLVPEFIAQSEEAQPQPRMLCQTRGILYLCHMVEMASDATALRYARQLYEVLRQRYLLPQGDHFAPPAARDGAARYELAFLLQAQTRLHQLDTIAGLEADLAATLNDVLSSPLSRWLAPREQGDFLELNALMHLYEALAYSHRCRPDQRTATYLHQLTQLAARHFVDGQHGVLAERVSTEGEILEYDLGHIYEWSSLLLIHRDQGFTLEDIDPAVQLKKAEEISHQAFNGELISHQLDNTFTPLGEDARIWVNLERLRSLALIQHPSAETLLGTILSDYFPNQLPEEYLKKTGPIKSTTGYHVIECYRAVAHAH
ncbi:AGE family epimerase/isomerase [Carnimonas bestiolae]|uniref:AGE family epimerase/isomerase n=1 Tax=Carnimonas bestiolae TaxID=3402172 RepID=UPI003EDBB2D9